MRAEDDQAAGHQDDTALGERSGADFGAGQVHEDADIRAPPGGPGATGPGPRLPNHEPAVDGRRPSPRPAWRRASPGRRRPARSWLRLACDGHHLRDSGASGSRCRYGREPRNGALPGIATGPRVSARLRRGSPFQHCRSGGIRRVQPVRKRPPIEVPGRLRTASQCPEGYRGPLTGARMPSVYGPVCLPASGQRSAEGLRGRKCGTEELRQRRSPGSVKVLANTTQEGSHSTVPSHKPSITTGGAGGGPNTGRRTYGGQHGSPRPQ